MVKKTTTRKPRAKAPAKPRAKPKATAKPKAPGAKPRAPAKPKTTTTRRTRTKKAPVPITHKSPFIPGNKFWERRSSHGPNPKFADPDKLMDACCQYFTDTQETPLVKEEAKVVDGVLTFVHQPLARPFTIGGMCIFIGISQRTWNDWKNQSGDHYRADLSPVMAWAEEVCRNQAFELAAAGMVNANIISRYLKLAETTDVTSTDGSMALPTTITLRGVRPEPREEDDE